jgi:hypothetical protein
MNTKDESAGEIYFPDEMKCVFFLFVCEDLVVKTRVQHKQCGFLLSLSTVASCNF